MLPFITVAVSASERLSTVDSDCFGWQQKTDEIIKSALLWDVMCGVARRSWARNKNSIETAIEFNKNYDGLGHITLPYIPEEKLIDEVVDKALKNN